MTDAARPSPGTSNSNVMVIARSGILIDEIPKVRISLAENWHREFKE
ncbi:uncharacterized protein METZ01_LOCUS225511 [marine metagenome]|uniref:Uncharacterized protein n=1 Tax=marine metagenome TaxID=408172 RepID=A0A382GDI0_9ZZZZ